MDIWGPVTPPTTYGQHFNTFLAAKRGLYIALQHAELAVDMVVEDDIGPTLDSYKVIFLADTHVSVGLAAFTALVPALACAHPSSVAVLLPQLSEHSRAAAENDDGGYVPMRLQPPVFSPSRC